jgi:hypothetical protein
VVRLETPVVSGHERQAHYPDLLRQHGAGIGHHGEYRVPSSSGHGASVGQYHRECEERRKRVLASEHRSGGLHVYRVHREQEPAQAGRRGREPPQPPHAIDQHRHAGVEQHVEQVVAPGIEAGDLVVHRVCHERERAIEMALAVGAGPTGGREYLGEMSQRLDEAVPDDVELIVVYPSEAHGARVQDHGSECHEELPQR